MSLSSRSIFPFKRWFSSFVDSFAYWRRFLSPELIMFEQIYSRKESFSLYLISANVSLKMAFKMSTFYYSSISVLYWLYRTSELNLSRSYFIALSHFFLDSVMHFCFTNVYSFLISSSMEISYWSRLSPIALLLNILNDEINNSLWNLLKLSQSGISYRIKAPSSFL